MPQDQDVRPYFNVILSAWADDIQIPRWSTSTRGNQVNSLELLNQDFSKASSSSQSRKAELNPLARLSGRRLPSVPRLRDLMVLFVYDQKIPARLITRREI